MDENSLRRVFAKAQKFGTLLDSTTAEFQEFAEQFVNLTNEIRILLQDKELRTKEIEELKAKLAKYEGAQTTLDTVAKA